MNLTLPFLGPSPHGCSQLIVFKPSSLVVSPRHRLRQRLQQLIGQALRGQHGSAFCQGGGRNHISGQPILGCGFKVDVSLNLSGAAIRRNMACQLLVNWVHHITSGGLIQFETETISSHQVPQRSRNSDVLPATTLCNKSCQFVHISCTKCQKRLFSTRSKIHLQNISEHVFNLRILEQSKSLPSTELSSSIPSMVSTPAGDPTLPLHGDPRFRCLKVHQKHHPAADQPKEQG